MDHFLKLFITTNKFQRKAILKTITRYQIKTLVEIAYNLLKGNISLNSVEKKKFIKHREFFRQLSNRKLSLKNKKQLLLRNLSALLLLVTTYLSIFKKWKN